ncbi:MAG: methionyl-tRNA formyltransferase [Peptococcaceae bacterium]|nr:methionyl-tRNA formyltransferase [Peptococcaceae bacterium]
MRVVFMGTPDFAVPCLQELLRGGHHVAAVVTQPDRPRGRGQQMAYSAVKQAAFDAGILVLQPQKVRDSDFVAQLRTYAPEVIVVVAFGQILPAEILTLPPYGCVNVHASLLPKYRGAAPIHWAVINGEPKTGVTTMLMDQGLDTGDMLLQAEIAIGSVENVGSVHDRLAELGSKLLTETLTRLGAGNLPRIPQSDADSTYAPMLGRKDENLALDRDNQTIVNHIRGMNPWPGAYTTYKGKVIKLWSALPVNDSSGATPGSVVHIDKNKGITLQAGQGQIMLLEVQPQGGKKMSAAAFANGYALSVGDKLGE